MQVYLLGFAFFVIIVVLISVYFGLFLQHNGHYLQKRICRGYQGKYWRVSYILRVGTLNVSVFVGHGFRDPESYTPSRGQMNT